MNQFNLDKDYYLFKEFFSAEQVKEMYNVYNKLHTNNYMEPQSVDLINKKVLEPDGKALRTAMHPYYEYAQRKLEYYLDTILAPTYHIGRVYEKGMDMKKHVDRACCEVSITFTIAHDKEHWPILVLDKDVPVEVNTYPGSVLLYAGDRIPHWREINTYNNIQYQHFMHWVDTSSEQGSLISLFDANIRGSGELFPARWSGLKTKNEVPVIND